MEERIEIKKGNIVSLKSNKEVKMTVSEVLANGHVECVWLNKDYNLSAGTFDPIMLIKEIIIPETKEEREARIQELKKKL